MVAQMPAIAEYNDDVVANIEAAKNIISGVRTIRLQKNIPNKNQLSLHILGEHNNYADSIIAKLANLSSIDIVQEKSATSITFMVGTTEYAVPMEGNIDVEAELKKLEEDLKYQQGFLRTVMGKLSNERFVANAPQQVVELERKKQSDAESKIKSIEERIKALKG